MACSTGTVGRCKKESWMDLWGHYFAMVTSTASFAARVRLSRCNIKANQEIILFVLLSLLWCSVVMWLSSLNFWFAHRQQQFQPQSTSQRTGGANWTPIQQSTTVTPVCIVCCHCLVLSRAVFALSEMACGFLTLGSLSKVYYHTAFWSVSHQWGHFRNDMVCNAHLRVWRKCTANFALNSVWMNLQQNWVLWLKYSFFVQRKCAYIVHVESNSTCPCLTWQCFPFVQKGRHLNTFHQKSSFWICTHLFAFCVAVTFVPGSLSNGCTSRLGWTASSAACKLAVVVQGHKCEAPFLFLYYGWQTPRFWYFWVLTNYFVIWWSVSTMESCSGQLLTIVFPCLCVYVVLPLHPLFSLSAKTAHTGTCSMATLV